MWRLQGNTARWQGDHLQAAIDLGHPEKGIESIVFLDRPLRTTALLQVHAPTVNAGAALQLDDRYVRGNDLIATYVDSGRQVRPQFRWRVCPGQGPQANAVQVDVIISLQTDSLLADPVLDICCQLGAESYEVFSEPSTSASSACCVSQMPSTLDVFLNPSGCMLAFHLAEKSLVFAQMFSTADVRRVVLARGATDRSVTSTISFFTGRVEKGVIRRTRLRSVFVREHEASQLLHDRWSDLKVAPPPLAT